MISSHHSDLMSTRLNDDQIGQLRKRLLQNLSELTHYKLLLKTNDFNQLVNHHHISLNILNNIANANQVEMSNPYNAFMKNNTQFEQPIQMTNPYQKNMSLIYSNNGKTQIINTNSQNKQNAQEWESQFDENVFNPPSYIVPPQNSWI